MTLDHIGAYDSGDQKAVAALLGMTDAPQVAAVAFGSPAEKAGIKAGDDILAIDGEPTGKLLAAARDHALFADELEERLAATPAGNPIHLQLRRDGKRIEAEIVPVPICAARFVIKTDEGFDAHSDGKNVALSSKFIAFARNDDELALVAGHELGHVVNRDGEAPSLAERRNMEDRADLLGAGLARCAGYDPRAGLEFWLRRDRTDVFKMLRMPTHRSPKSRVSLMQAEAMTGPCPPAVGRVRDADRSPSALPR